MMSIHDLISLVASIASLILAVIAIWLSLYFYRESSRLSESTQEAAKGIAASVQKLEALFNSLYADTFSMMRDTLGDMRRHLWPEKTTAGKLEEEVERKADQKIEALREDVTKQISSILQNQRVTDENVSSVTAQLQEALGEAIAGTRKVEKDAREETIRREILRSLSALPPAIQVPAESFVKNVADLHGCPWRYVVHVMEKMKKEGLISTSDPDIGPDTKISLKK
jgi:hypothetical protein